MQELQQSKCDAINDNFFCSHRSPMRPTAFFVIRTLLSVPEITGIKSGHGGMAEFGMVKADKHKKLNYRKGPNRSAVFSCCNV